MDQNIVASGNVVVQDNTKSTTPSVQKFKTMTLSGDAVGQLNGPQTQSDKPQKTFNVMYCETMTLSGGAVAQRNEKR
jgi:hypothetical protein